MQERGEDNTVNSREQGRAQGLWKANCPDVSNNREERLWFSRSGGDPCRSDSSVDGKAAGDQGQPPGSSQAWALARPPSCARQSPGACAVSLSSRPIACPPRVCSPSLVPPRPPGPGLLPPPPWAVGAGARSPRRPTREGELIAATLYPYWKEDPKAAIRVARASTSDSLCGRRGHGEVRGSRGPSLVPGLVGRRNGTGRSASLIGSWSWNPPSAHLGLGQASATGYSPVTGGCPVCIVGAPLPHP